MEGSFAPAGNEKPTYMCAPTPAPAMPSARPPPLSPQIAPTAQGAGRRASAGVRRWAGPELCPRVWARTRAHQRDGCQPFLGRWRVTLTRACKPRAAEVLAPGITLGSRHILASFCREPKALAPLCTVAERIGVTVNSPPRASAVHCEPVLWYGGYTCIYGPGI
jgi:hypothetical protein